MNHRLLQVAALLLALSGCFMSGYSLEGAADIHAGGTLDAQASQDGGLDDGNLPGDAAILPEGDAQATRGGADETCTGSGCSLTCVDTQSCPADCPPGQSCTKQCNQSSSCNTMCPTGSSCAIDCGSAKGCNVLCEAGSQCDVTCTAGDCNLDCVDQASCSLWCANDATACNLRTCPMQLCAVPTTTGLTTYCKEDC